MNAIHENIYRNGLFSGFLPDKTDKILYNAPHYIRSYKKNDIIFFEKDVRSKIGIVLSGTVFINKFFPSGKVVILDTRSVGDLLGEDLVFAPSQPCEGERITAGSKCSIMLISYDDFRALLIRNEDILSNYLNYYSHKVLLLKHRLGILSLSSIQSKIAAYVYTECRKNKSSVLRLQFTRSDLSRFLDVSRPSLIRELNKLERQAIIELDGDMIKIINMEELFRLVIQK